MKLPLGCIKQNLEFSRFQITDFPSEEAVVRYIRENYFYNLKFHSKVFSYSLYNITSDDKRNITTGRIGVGSSVITSSTYRLVEFIYRPGVSFPIDYGKPELSLYKL